MGTILFIVFISAFIVRIWANTEYNKWQETLTPAQRAQIKHLHSME